MPDKAPRWVPDDQLIPALLNGTTAVQYDTMNKGDRAWAVAGLRLAGVTVGAIAEQLACSERQVNQVQADPAAILATFYMAEIGAFEDTLRMLQGDVARLDRERMEAVGSAERYRAQLGRMIDAALVGELGPTFAKCGHPKTRYNTYTAPKTGKTSCRMCHADAQADYRQRCRDRDSGQTMDYGQAGEFIQARLALIAERRAVQGGPARRAQS